MTNKSCGPVQGEGFLCEVGSENIRGERVWRKKIIKRYMCRKVPNMGDRM